MSDVVIVEAVRSPVGQRNGGLSTMHPADLLAAVQSAVIERSGIDPAEVDQVVGGCVSQVGEQAFNIARTAWLSAGLPLSVAATTVDTQCGSSQQATNLATSLVGAGVVDVAVACGVEAMSRVPIGSNASGELRPADPEVVLPAVRVHLAVRGRRAHRRQVGHHPRRRRPVRLPVPAARRRGLGRGPLRQPDRRRSTLPTSTRRASPPARPTPSSRDEGLRETTLEKLATLKPVAREDGVHTAGSSSQISDGAAALLLTTAEKADELGLRPRARVVDTCLVGVDPVLMLTGPIDATQRLLERTGLTMDDIDVIEINEAFASVVLAWAKELDVDLAKVNPNGGAIALGHPLGGTGAVLITKALHELERTGGRYGLVTMCCGGGLGTGTIIERL